MIESSPPDRLSGILERFRLQAQLHHAGELCGKSVFNAADGYGFVHLLRRGELDVRHPTASKRAPHRPDAFAKSLRLTEPTVLFYPAPLTHHFLNPASNGPDLSCARLRFEGGALHPLVRALPAVLALPLAQIPDLGQALELLFAETDRPRCGGRVLVDRLFEVVMIQILRWLLDNPQQAGVSAGLIYGLSDARLTRVLLAIHETPGAAWSLQRMAECAGMSRTTFATTFRDVLGQTPADYLASWRMSLLQSRLRAGKSVKHLAEELGYANPSALSRVFTATFGVSPRAWLKNSGI